MHYYCSGMGKPVLFWMEKETTAAEKGLLLMVPKRARLWGPHSRAPRGRGSVGRNMNNNFDLVFKGRNG